MQVYMLNSVQAEKLSEYTNDELVNFYHRYSLVFRGGRDHFGQLTEVRFMPRLLYRLHFIILHSVLDLLVLKFLFCLFDKTFCRQLVGEDVMVVAVTNTRHVDTIVLVVREDRNDCHLRLLVLYRLLAQE
jgi:hypothetical protein